MPSSALEQIQDAERTGSIFRMFIAYTSIVIVIAIPTLVIGAVYHGQCPIEPNISVYLIVQGTVVTILFSSKLVMVSQLSYNIVITL
jgi:hypothetical protein